MSVVDHLEELRRRILISAVAYAVGVVVAYIFYASVLHFLTIPLHKGTRIGHVTVEGLQVAGVATGFLVRMKISFYVGLVIALPVLLWQVWRYIVPGLTRRERRLGMEFVASALGLFLLGGFIAYLILPQAIGFLLGFARDPLRPLLFADQYLSFVCLVVLAFGLSFEFPLLLVFLAGAGVVTSRKLGSWRRGALFMAFLVGAVATPSQDPFSMTMMAVPLYVLYEATILVIKYAMKK